MFISPMLLHKSDRPFDDDNYITELKLDGFRTMWTKFDNKVRIYTRHKNEITSKFPELVNLSLPNGTVLDGEIIVTDNQGKPDFEAVMERFMSKKSEHQISFSVFDIIYFNGEKITNLPLLERKEILEEVIPKDTPLLNKVQWIVGNGEQYFELIKQHELEGIVQKKANSKYQINKRSHDWLKVINYQYTDAFITGLRKNEFGLLLGIEENNRIKPAGIMEFLVPAAKKMFYEQYKDLILKEDTKFIFLDPKMKCRVKFRNYTKDGKLRIPSFVEYIS